MKNQSYLKSLPNFSHQFVPVIPLLLNELILITPKRDINCQNAHLQKT